MKAPKTHLGFTNMASEMRIFTVIAIWNSKFWFGSPCSHFPLIFGRGPPGLVRLPCLLYHSLHFDSRQMIKRCTYFLLDSTQSFEKARTKKSLANSSLKKQIGQFVFDCATILASLHWPFYPIFHDKLREMLVIFISPFKLVCFDYENAWKTEFVYIIFSWHALNSPGILSTPALARFLSFSKW